MMKNILLLLVLCLTYYSCKEENPTWEEENYMRCKENMTFFCDFDENDVTFFKGKLNGEEFCISAPHNENVNYYGIGTLTTTSVIDPTLSPDNKPHSSFYTLGILPRLGGPDGSTLPDFAPILNINTPIVQDSIIYPAKKYIEDFIQLGDLVLRDKDVDEFSGFDFYISWKCDMKPYTSESEFHPTVGYRLSPLNASQDDMVFRVSKIKKIEDAWNIKYNITFEIECDLYYWKENEYFGRLEDGVFKTVIEIPK